MIEFFNIRGRRYIATANGPEECRDLRLLGCPERIAVRVEQRSAIRHSTPARPTPRTPAGPTDWRRLAFQQLARADEKYAAAVARHDDRVAAEIDKTLDQRALLHEIGELMKLLGKRSLPLDDALAAERRLAELRSQLRA